MKSLDLNPKKEMNLRIKCGALLVGCAIVIIVFMARSVAKPIVSNEDGIVTSAESTKSDNGKIYVVCSITHESPYILASSFWYHRNYLTASYFV